MPDAGKHEADDDNVRRESWVRKELTNGEEVSHARHGRGCKEGWTAYPAEIAGTEEQRYEQNRTQTVDPVGWSELHRSSVPVRSRVSVSPQSLSQTAVRGARSGACSNSAARRIRSSATSMS